MDMHAFFKYPVYNKRKGGTHMAEMKNICGKIPMELHTKVRQEIEQREISTQQFIQQVIEEHFTEKGGQISMAIRTVAVQVSEELFARFKAAVAKKGCRQKDFLIALIEKAVEEIEAEFGDEKMSGTPAPETEDRTAEPEEMETAGSEENAEAESAEPEETAEAEPTDLEETAGTEPTEPEETEEAEPTETAEMGPAEPQEPMEVEPEATESSAEAETDEPGEAEETAAIETEEAGDAVQEKAPEPETPDTEQEENGTAKRKNRRKRKQGQKTE